MSALYAFPTNHNLDVALDLARQGLYVFPCQSSGPTRKQPCARVYWRSASTRDEKKVREFWRAFPNAIPGIDLAKSGFLVVDCDMKPNDGFNWLSTYAARFNDDLSSSPKVKTPSGGCHLFYRNTDPPLTNSRGSLPPKTECGIDIRGHGGFVIGAGSIFADGGEYVLEGSIFDAPPLPTWLVELLSKMQPKPLPPIVVKSTSSPDRLGAYGRVALEELAAELASKVQHERNNEACRIAFRAGQLVGGGCLTHSDAYAALSQAALSWGIRANDKALGPKGTISRALQAGANHPRGPEDRDLPTVRIMLGSAGEFIDAETGEILTDGAQPTPPSELPEHLTNVPGLVGNIARWITDTALYPQPGLALGAALVIVGTAAGRHLAGPTMSGTHLYVVGLSPSGAGKDHPLKMISTVLTAAGLQQHIGPSEFISMPAVIGYVVRSPLGVCPMDEFGSFLKRINNKRASGFEGAVSGALRSLWGSSFAAYTTPEWASRKSDTVFSPSLSIYGVSTIGEFYSSLEGADVLNGVLNRFLIIETDIRPTEREPKLDKTQVPYSIVDGIKRIYYRDTIISAQLSQGFKAPTFDRLTITPEAEQVRRSLVEKIHYRSDENFKIAPFLARTAENAIRLATIVAVGQSKMVIDLDDMQWACDFALWSSERLADGAGLYIADSEAQAAANAVKRAIRNKGGRISKRDLTRSLDHKYRMRDLEEILKSLMQSEEIILEKLINPHGGHAVFFYKLLVDNCAT